MDFRIPQFELRAGLQDFDSRCAERERVYLEEQDKLQRATSTSTSLQRPLALVPVQKFVQASRDRSCIEDTTVTEDIDNSVSQAEESERSRSVPVMVNNNPFVAWDAAAAFTNSMQVQMDFSRRSSLSTTAATALPMPAGLDIASLMKMKRGSHAHDNHEDVEEDKKPARTAHAPPPPATRSPARKPDLSDVAQHAAAQLAGSTDPDEMVLARTSTNNSTRRPQQSRASPGRLSSARTRASHRTRTGRREQAGLTTSATGSRPSVFTSLYADAKRRSEGQRAADDARRSEDGRGGGGTNNGGSKTTTTTSISSSRSGSSISASTARGRGPKPNWVAPSAIKIQQQRFPATVASAPAPTSVSSSKKKKQTYRNHAEHLRREEEFAARRAAWREAERERTERERQEAELKECTFRPDSSRGKPPPFLDDESRTSTRRLGTRGRNKPALTLTSGRDLFGRLAHRLSLSSTPADGAAADEDDSGQELRARNLNNEWDDDEYDEQGEEASCKSHVEDRSRSPGKYCFRDRVSDDALLDALGLGGATAQQTKGIGRVEETKPPEKAGHVVGRWPAPAAFGGFDPPTRTSSTLGGREQMSLETPALYSSCGASGAKREDDMTTSSSGSAPLGSGFGCEKLPPEKIEIHLDADELVCEYEAALRSRLADGLWTIKSN
eukprot:CAMPEP_0178989178 /NCGR_PEP_ID=MMETSP0795-20121207/4217_1 /TAXON_ID=88552 /ORGANISM="Amoebophrya sp., Strain Ameob2" /LENGTH=668 /DNA_ID=CAMNT_0020680525 /DNA_START=52 /DNA_END=2058 /DNA_ORIENTATION=-